MIQITAPKEITKYDKQSHDFLEKTGTDIYYEYVGLQPYFPDDKKSRDVYKIKIERYGKTYVFAF